MCFSYVCSIGACLALSISSSFLWLGLAGLLFELLLYHVVAVKSLSIHHHLLLVFFFFFELSWIKEDYDKKNNVEKERIRHKTKTTGASLIIIVQVIFYFL